MTGTETEENNKVYTNTNIPSQPNRGRLRLPLEEDICFKNGTPPVKRAWFAKLSSALATRDVCLSADDKTHISELFLPLKGLPRRVLVEGLRFRAARPETLKYWKQKKPKSAPFRRQN